MADEPLRYRRRFASFGALVTLAEGVAVAAPLGTFFHFHRLSETQRDLIGRAGPVVLGGAWLIWWLALRWWRGPLDRAVQRRRAGQVVDAGALQLATRVTLLLPRRAALLRAAMVAIAALGLSSLLALRASLPVDAIVRIVTVAALNGLAVQVFRVLAWARVLDRVRDALGADGDPLRMFHRTYRARLARAGFATGALAVTVVALFVLVFMQPNLENFLRLELLAPLTVAPLAVAWLWSVRRLSRPVERYLAAACDRDPARHPTREDPRGIAAYRAAQLLPYLLGGTKLAIAVAGEALLALEATLALGVEREYTVAILAEAMIITVGAALYDVLWHRLTLRPLLAQLATRHRPSPGSVRSPFGVRARMLLFLGVLTLFAGTLSLLSSFVQYTSLATGFVERQSELRRDRIVAELKARSAMADQPLGPADVAAVLAAEAPGDKAVLYYLPPGDGATVLAFGDGATAPPPLPEAQRARMLGHDRGRMVAPALRLTGSWARVALERAGRMQDLGALAVLYPGSWGRSLSFDPQITVLLFFFALLFAASMGIVALVAADFTGPIRRLEERAEAMARGDLNRPVAHVAGEADEVGRLTLSFEEMRRALNEKLRSSTEINLSLEAEVTRRTAELERRNQELKDALDALRRAQAELVRSEKLASMGRLVAGIAHEINNPVNAIANTVGPLDAALEEAIGQHPALGQAAGEAREMMRVIQSGARRTKEIVQALHNYSRGDDDTLVEVDLHRGIDESLDLLRHHLRRGIRVERNYGPIGPVLGNAGQLQQVFMNLLTNAAQAIGERGGGGTIRITTAREAAAVVVRIADDGPGIPEQALPRIFDPFFTTKDVGQGSGLGLSIVHGILERHGGGISVESEPGRGTTFTVRLPAERDAVVAAAAAAAAKASGS